MSGAWRATPSGLMVDVTNTARDIERHKNHGEGFHCWAEEEIAQYRACHASSTKARLAFKTDPRGNRIKRVCYVTETMMRPRFELARFIVEMTRSE